MAFILDKEGNYIPVFGNISGGESITVDDELSPTSENPIQNKVLYPSLSGFLPDGTIINVKLDGSGDFTTVEDAIAYLTDKWSNGTVTIQIGAGTFNEPQISPDSGINIGKLIIDGAGMGQTIINSSANTKAQGAINFNNISYLAMVSNLTITHTQSASMGAIGVIGNSVVNVANVESIDFDRGVIFSLGGTTKIINTTLKVSNTVEKTGGLYGGNIFLVGIVNLEITNCANGVFVTAGCLVQSNSTNYKATNVTNRYNTTPNTVSASGVILGMFTET